MYLYYNDLKRDFVIKYNKAVAKHEAGEGNDFTIDMLVELTTDPDYSPYIGEQRAALEYIVNALKGVKDENVGKDADFVVNWDLIPDGFDYFAIDADGRGNIYTTEPYVNGNNDEWMYKNGYPYGTDRYDNIRDYMEYDYVTYAHMWEGDKWKKTKQVRPL